MKRPRSVELPMLECLSRFANEIGLDFHSHLYGFLFLFYLFNNEALPTATHYTNTDTAFIKLSA